MAIFTDRFFVSTVSQPYKISGVAWSQLCAIKIILGRELRLVSNDPWDSPIIISDYQDRFSREKFILEILGND